MSNINSLLLFLTHSFSTLSIYFVILSFLHDPDTLYILLFYNLFIYVFIFILFPEKSSQKSGKISVTSIFSSLSPSGHSGRGRDCRKGREEERKRKDDDRRSRRSRSRSRSRDRRRSRSRSRERRYRLEY